MNSIKSMFLLFIIIWFTISHSAAIAQTTEDSAICPAGIPTTANDEKFELRPNGEVLHIASNLIFMRCSLGQSWDGSTCSGEATRFTWQQALQQSNQNIYNENFSWRLPNIKELSQILERACVRPSINETIFPNTPASDYWTSTPAISQNGSVWSLAFTNSSNAITPINRSLHVRLVRNRVANE